MRRGKIAPLGLSIDVHFLEKPVIIILQNARSDIRVQNLCCSPRAFDLLRKTEAKAIGVALLAQAERFETQFL